MSRVTSVTIVVDHPTELYEVLTGTNFSAPGSDYDQFLHYVDPDTIYAPKAHENDVYVGGFNHCRMSPDELVEWFRALPWHPLSSAQLLVSLEGEVFRQASVGWGSQA